MLAKLYTRALIILSAALILTVFISFLFTRAMYKHDYAYFTTHSPLTILIVIVFFIAFLFICKLTLNRPVGRNILLLILSLSALVQLLIILFIPLEPLYDMVYIQQSAVEIHNGIYTSLQDEGYLASNPNNILLAFLSYVLYGVFGDIFFPLKVINIFCTTLITLFSYKLFQSIHKKDSLLVLCLLAFFPPALFYANQVYSDVIAAMLFITSSYLYMNHTNQKYRNASIALLAFGILLRPVGIVFFIAILLHTLIFKKEIRAGTYAVVVLMAVVLTFNVSTSLLTNNSKGMPVWSYIYMGINKDKFGFQDNSHNKNRSLHDVLARVEAYGILDTTKIVSKKILWTWGEGTYQIERYGIGIEKVTTYKYPTIFTNLNAIKVIKIKDRRSIVEKK